jgi:hypothetical protein
MNTTTHTHRILPRTCPVCGRNDYRGTLQAHYAAWHPAKATPMVPR